MNMKKINAILILGLMTSLILTGCFLNRNDTSDTDAPEVKIPTTGSELDELAGIKLTELDSYTGIQTLNANLTVNEIDFSILSTTKTRVSGQSSDIYSALTESTLITDYTILKTNSKGTETVDLVEGFKNGYMFRSSYVGLSSSKMKSEISRENYLNYAAKKAEKSEAKLGDNTPKSSELDRLENGDWKAVLKDFDKEYINNYVQSLMGSEIYFDTTVDSMTVTITTTENMVYKSIAIEFEFNNPTNAKNTLNSLSATFDFSDTDSTTIEEYDLTEYTLVPDLRLLYEVENALDNAKKADFGSCNLTFDYISSISSDLKQEYALSYNNENGLSYNLTISQDEMKQILRYSDQKLTSEYYSDGNKLTEATADSTDREQINTMHSLIDYADFNPYLVSNIYPSEEEENTVVLNLIPSEAQKLSNKYTHLLIELKITVENEKIARYRCTMKYYYSHDTSQAPFETIATDATYDWSKK